MSDYNKASEIFCLNKTFTLGLANKKELKKFLKHNDCKLKEFTLIDESNIFTNKDFIILPDCDYLLNYGLYKKGLQILKALDYNFDGIQYLKTKKVPLILKTEDNANFFIIIAPKLKEDS